MSTTTIKLLKCPEVAEILSISKATAYLLVRDGTIPSVRFGGKSVRVRPEDLEAFIEKNKTEGPEAPIFG